jgi:hypothetical protein
MYEYIVSTYVYSLTISFVFATELCGVPVLIETHIQEVLLSHLDRHTCYDRSF